MDYERVALRIAGIQSRTAREERKAAISRAFRLADIAFRVAGLDEENTASVDGTAGEETSADDQVGRIVEEHSQYCVKSEKPGSNWSGGCYDTKGEAEDRLKQVERAKHAG